MLVKAKKIDLSRYLGKWFQVAAFPAWFQKNCKNITATYTDREGYIEVKNTCRSKGRVKKQIGKAFLTDKDNVLKVQFFPPFKANYIIEFVDENYEYAIVGSGSKSYLWFLARQLPVPQDIYEQMLTIAKRRKYDVSRLVE